MSYHLKKKKNTPQLKFVVSKIIIINSSSYFYSVRTHSIGQKWQ